LKFHDGFFAHMFLQSITLLMSDFAVPRVMSRAAEAPIAATGSA
jgi:hypothetical protein